MENTDKTEIAKKAEKNPKTKYALRFAVLLLCLVSLLGVTAEAYSTYPTYIYAFGGVGLVGGFVQSPDAYVPEQRINSEYINKITQEKHAIADFLGDVPLDGPQDLFIGPDGSLYIADQRNSRIVVLNADYSGKFIIDLFVNMWGIPDSLREPKGVFATETEIYVADTEKNRIVVFDIDGKHLRIVNEPDDDVFPEGHVYKPVALSVDKAGRIYVVSSTTNLGIIAMTNEGEFLEFMGAQAAVVNPFQIFWRNFQTRRQREQMMRNVATEYNNISIDLEGFLYVTTSSIEPGAQQGALFDRSSAYAPIKRLNPQGVDVLRRSGFIGPGGEAMAGTFRVGDRGPKGPSKIIDVALGPEGTWSIIDEERSRVYTYDEDGRLLFIFGDDGKYFGNIESIQAIVYQDDKMLLLDKTNSSFTIYKRTQYGDIIVSALANQRNRQYSSAVDDWNEILKRNNNFDLAYIGVGKSLYRDGEYQEAMEKFKLARDVDNYSQAFKRYRELWIRNNVIVIPLVVIALVAAILLFFRFANKVNKKDQIRAGRKLKLSSHVLYGFYIIFHPFDGFWDMKHEKRGSVLGATIYLILACAVFIYKAFGEGYIVNQYGIYNDFLAESLGVIIPVVLFVIANWCLTTLFDGEGSMKDIYMATCYSLVPIPPVIFLSTLATHFIVKEEIEILNMVATVMAVWVGALLFFGIMVVHDYSLGKNVVTFLGTAVGMAFIMFVTVLFSALLNRMVSFINSIVVEVSYRL